MNGNKVLVLTPTKASEILYIPCKSGRGGEGFATEVKQTLHGLKAPGGWPRMLAGSALEKGDKIILRNGEVYTVDYTYLNREKFSQLCLTRSMAIRYLLGLEAGLR